MLAILLLPLLACPGRSHGGGDDDDDDTGGDGDGDADGDPVGVWEVADTCMHYDAEFPGCAAADLTIEGGFEGTVTFSDDGTFVRDLVLDATTVVALPASCLGGATCAQIEANLEDSNPGSSCENDGDGCTCSVPLEMDGVDSGDWEVDGTTLVLTVDGEDESSELCVQGDSILVRVQDDEAGIGFDVIGRR